MQYVRIQHWGKLAREWSSDNPILRENELGIETDTKQFKIGDGKTPWNNLQYYFPSSIKAQNNIGKISFDANDANGVKINLTSYAEDHCSIDIRPDRVHMFTSNPEQYSQFRGDGFYLHQGNATTSITAASIRIYEENGAANAVKYTLLNQDYIRTQHAEGEAVQYGWDSITNLPYFKIEHLGGITHRLGYDPNNKGAFIQLGESVISQVGRYPVSLDSDYSNEQTFTFLYGDPLQEGYFVEIYDIQNSSDYIIDYGTHAVCTFIELQDYAITTDGKLSAQAMSDNGWKTWTDDGAGSGKHTKTLGAKYLLFLFDDTKTDHSVSSYASQITPQNFTIGNNKVYVKLALSSSTNNYPHICFSSGQSYNEFSHDGWRLRYNNIEQARFTKDGLRVGNTSSTNYTVISSNGSMDRIKTQYAGRFISLGFNNYLKPAISMYDGNLNNSGRMARVHYGVDYVEFYQECTDVANFPNGYDLTRVYHNRIEIYNHGVNKINNTNKKGIWKVITTAYQTKWYFCVLDNCPDGVSDPTGKNYSLVARISAKGYTGPANSPFTEAERSEGILQ